MCVKKLVKENFLSLVAVSLFVGSLNPQPVLAQREHDGQWCPNRHVFAPHYFKVEQPTGPRTWQQPVSQVGYGIHMKQNVLAGDNGFFVQKSPQIAQAPAFNPQFGAPQVFHPVPIANLPFKAEAPVMPGAGDRPVQSFSRTVSARPRRKKPTSASALPRIAGYGGGFQSGSVIPASFVDREESVIGRVIRN